MTDFARLGPGKLIELVAAARAAGEISRLVAVVPYAQFLGVSMVEVDGELRGLLRFGEHQIGNPMLPAIHGGVISALLESTAIFQLIWEAEVLVLPKTITLTVDYLRSGRAVDTYARGVVTRHGRRVANVRIEAWQEDRSRPIAVASAHFLVEAGEASPEAPQEPPQDPAGA